MSTQRAVNPEACSHDVGSPDRLCVIQGRPTREHREMWCPCCGLSGWLGPDVEPSPCPYCDVMGVTR